MFTASSVPWYVTPDCGNCLSLSHILNSLCYEIFIPGCSGLATRCAGEGGESQRRSFSRRPLALSTFLFFIFTYQHIFSVAQPRI
ncbi:hypothetical protein E2C01_010959 [Portunus trituberculatus]|uniref:Uncharacterized protein n=1 Tax=Portunus trituberculatus TaxID=210409 RepID=A0A5B7DA92_PORTR|nr:hypothetical protein [Portunus trituberculatus]